MRVKGNVLLFAVLMILALPAGFIYGTATQAKDTPDPLAVNDRVTIELVATMEDGKVRIYRLMDYASAGFAARVCHITVGELHGKTVAMDCTK
jgi:hypothetical protein